MSNPVYSIYTRIKENISKVIVGKGEVIDLMLIALFCRGHMLIEDVPGTGKTMLVKSLAASIDCEAKRIQFTPDLLPSDITGINYFNMKTSEFEFVPGPVFANIVLADEINRATPKTQSGLLECMEENQATIDGVTYNLARPFMVVATQNPIESMGVFPLPEAQLDRFLIKTSMQYPSHDEGVDILERFNSENPLVELDSVATKEDIIMCQEEVNKVYVHRDLMDYIVRICEATREYENVALGVSPRGALSLLRVAKGFAAISNRDFLIPDDVKRAAMPVLPHRLVMTSSSRIKKNAANEVIEDVLNRVHVPTEAVLGWSAGK
ncbi:MAG: MoxR family ATPase [Clostridiales bacterium]|nr:MoxR family ATPase [Clostridiales bacterium]